MLHRPHSKDVLTLYQAKRKELRNGKVCGLFTQLPFMKINSKI